MFQSKSASTPETLFFIGGLTDMDLASNQSVKNTLKYLSQFGYLIHFFSAFPEDYRILQNPQEALGGRVVFHRTPRFLTPLYDFIKFLKDILGMRRKKNSRKKINPAEKIRYFDEYNLMGRLFYIAFFLFYVPVEMIRVSFYYFQLKPQLFYGLNGQGTALASFLGKLYRKPTIQRWHGSFYTEEDVKKIQTRWIDKFLALDGGFSKWLPSDAVIITNDGTQGDKVFRMIGVPPEKIHFWMNGMDLEGMSLPPDWDTQRFKEGLSLSGKKIVMMASRLVLWKRVDRGLDCLYRLVNDYGMDDVVLLILGQGQEDEPLQALTKALNLEPYVRFLGAVPHPQMAKYYSIADVFLNLYDVSNLSNPLLEAMCCGAPIVTLDDGSTAGLLQEGVNAFLVPHEKLETDLPLRVRDLLTDASLRRRIQENAKKSFHEKVLSWRERMLLEHELLQGFMPKQKKVVSEAQVLV